MLLNSVMLKGLNKLQTICQIAKKLLLKGGKFVSDGLYGIQSECACTSPNPTIKMLILCEMHMI